MFATEVDKPTRPFHLLTRDGVRRRIRTDDGRILSVVEYGPPDGFPVLYLHGTPGAATEWSVFGNNDTLENHNLRLSVTRASTTASSTKASGTASRRCFMEMFKGRGSVRMPRMGPIRGQ